MPQIFKVGSWLVYFWMNENNPLEPIHVHVSQGVPTSNATKIWITKSGKCLICNNNSKIPRRQLNIIIKVIESRIEEVINLWISTFGQITYFC